MLHIFKYFKLKYELKKFIEYAPNKLIFPLLIFDENISFCVRDPSDFKAIEDLKKTIYKAKNKTLGEYIQYLVDSKNIKNDSIIYIKANIPKEYWNKLIHDKYTNPSKIKLVRIGLALELDLVEINELLKMAGYCFKPNQQDCAIIWFFEKKIYDTIQVDKLLSSVGLDSIYSDKALA